MKLNKKFLFLFCTFFFFSESIGILYAKEKCSDSILTELYLTKQNNLFLSIKNCDSTAIKVFPKFYIDLDRSVSKILLWNRVLGENSWTFGALTGYLEEPYRRDFYELKDSIQPNKRVWLPLLNISQGKTQEVYAEVHLVYYVNGSSGYKIISNTPTLIINNSEQKNVQLIAERVDRVGDFNPESLSRKYGYIEFDRGEGKYAFDNGKLDWYKKSVKVDRFYKPVAKGYIAPWKLVPVGENDVVTAKYKGSKNIDLKKVRFASEPNTAALPAKFNEAEQTWTISLRSVSPGASYDVFAVYEGVAIGKLRVVSYAKQQHKVTLVPINEVRLDKTTIEQGLNAIYNPVGVQFTVNVDESMRGNYSWEVDSEKDGLLSTVGKSFWGYDKELKESTEMLNLQKTYQQEAGTLDGVYLFVLNGAKGLEGQNKYLLGEMPRKSRFGYIFTANSYNTTSLVRTIAHEVGHGIFTLQHTFDNEYGKGTLKETENLLDYKEGTDLVAFQWNVMANPAVFTGMDKASKGKLELNTNEYIGFAPNGQVIKISGWVKFSRDSSSYFISGLELTDGTKYTWVKAENKFISKERKVYPLIVNEAVSGKIAIWADSKNPNCYTWYKFIEVKNYTSKDFESIKRRIANDDGKNWHPDLVSGASDDCMAKSEKEIQEGIELPHIKDITSNDTNDTIDGLFDKLYFVGKASDFQADILAEIKQAFKRHEKNTFTRKEVSKDISIIISIDGDDSQEISSLKNQKNSYLHFIFTIKNGKAELLRFETSDKFGDKLSHICELIKNEPWASQAVILYEVADLLDQGIEYLKIPESVWSCNNKSNVYKKVISYLLDTQFPVLIGNDFIGNKLNEESKFAFVCGLWDGTVDIVQSVPQLVKLLTCVLHEDCRESASSKWESFKNAVIEDENGNILCHQNEYFCKAMQMISLALNELVADNCKVAHTVGSVVGPIAVMCLGDVAAGEAVLTRLGSVGSGLKYAIKGLQLCDKVTDITRPLAKGLKVSAVLVKKAGKLLPEIRIEGKTILHYVGDKLHIRRFDAVTKQTIDEPVEESNLSQKLEKAFEGVKEAINIGKYSLASISKERGFIDLLPNLLKKEGLTMDDFRYMMLKNVNALTESEKVKLARIRNAIPKPDANTVMQKVIPADDIEQYVNGIYSKVRGSVSVASDTKHLKSFEDYYYGLRLDYEKTKFHLSKNSCGVIRFKSEDAPQVLVIPTSEDMDYPFTAHGFTSGNNGRLGVPEWKLVKDAEFSEGAEIWEVFNDGTEKLRAIFDGVKFNRVK